MIADGLPARLRKAVDQQLAPGERLVRLEQPDSARFRRRLAWGTVAIGLLFALFTAIALSEGSWLFAALYAIFAAVFLSGPSLLRRIAHNTVYAITSERVVVVKHLVGGRLEARSIYADMLNPCATLYGDGPAGDVELIAGYRSDSSSIDQLTRLFALRDARGTEAVLRQLAQSSSKSSL